MTLCLPDPGLPCLDFDWPHPSLSRPQVVLKGLPEDFATEVEERNDSVQNNTVSFLLTISKLSDMRKDCQQRLSEIGKAENVHAV